MIEERRRHSKNLLREMRLRAIGWTATELCAVIEVLQHVRDDVPASGLETRCDRNDQPADGGTSPVRPPEVNS